MRCDAEEVVAEPAVSVRFGNGRRIERADLVVGDGQHVLRLESQQRPSPLGDEEFARRREREVPRNVEVHDEFGRRYVRL